MTEQTTNSSNRKSEFPLAVSLAATLVEAAWGGLEERLAATCIDTATREAGPHKRESALAMAQSSLDTQIAAREEEDYERKSGKEIPNAVSLLNAEPELMQSRITAINDLLKLCNEKVSELQKAQAELARQRQELEDAKSQLDLIVAEKVRAECDRIRTDAERRARLAFQDDLDAFAKSHIDLQKLLGINPPHPLGHPVLNQMGEIVEFVGMAVDFTAERRTKQILERALSKAQKAEAFLAEAQRLSQTGSFSWHVSTGELFWSDEMYVIYGFDRTVELTVENVHQRVHPDDIATILEVVGQAVKVEKGWELEHRLLMPDGSVKYLRAVTRAEKSFNGELEIIGALMDVTASKQAQERLRLSHLELAHVTRLATLGELAASIAHEVNQPLGAVVTSADACLRWLDKSPPNLKEIREAISSIVRDGHRGSEVIARVRALLKKEPHAKTLLDINVVVREIVNLVEPNLRGTTVELTLPEGLPHILGDRVLIQQVLLNLIFNAVDAMKVVTDRPRYLGIRTDYSQEGEILVAVKDVGIGIGPEQANHIFTAFYTTKSDGLGLGLPLCRSVIEDHGGKLWLEANEGHGVTFWFTLPDNG